MRDPPKMMACGHAANATCNGKPVCAICLDEESARTPMEEQPDLSARTAECCYHCGAKQQSSTSLAFFEWRPDQEFDEYYCGCRGWN